MRLAAGEYRRALGDGIGHMLLHFLERLSINQRPLRHAGLDALVGHLELPVYVAPQPVMDQVVGFPIHRGVLAVAERGPARSPAALLDGLGPGPRQILVLSQLANHDNVGGIFRNAAAFGVDAVLLDETTCDPLYRKSIRVSVGGALVVPFAQAPIAEILHALGTRGFTVYGLSPRGAMDLRTLQAPPRYALVLGAEGPGLPDELLAQTEPVRIDMAPGFDSLNVSVTSGIALFALGQGR